MINDVSQSSSLLWRTWDDFYAEIPGKKIFIMGVGGGFRFFIENYSNDIQIYGLIDNDPRYTGCLAGDMLPYANRPSIFNLRIFSLDLLAELDKSDVVVLISSAKYYNIMYEQLLESGFTNCFSLACMEAGFSEKVRSINPCYEMYDYVAECNKHEIEKVKIIIWVGYYGDHGKSITRAIQKKADIYDIVWVVKNMNLETPDGVRKVYCGNWRKLIYEMMTARIWIMDELVPDYVMKREGQIYIQVKHWSSITLKGFYYEDPGYISDEYAHSVVDRNLEMTDYIMVGSDFDEESCRRGFRFDGTYVRVGSPRSDILFDDSVKGLIHDKYDIPIDTRIILYVPTYREHDKNDNELIQLQTTFQQWIDAFKHRFGGEWCLMLKLHPATVGRMKHEYDSEGIIDASIGSDCQTLVAASDAIITDYSSVMFEPAFIKEPVFLFAPDKEDYIGGERELLLDYDSLPFPIAETNERLSENIMSFNQKKYEAEVTAFLDKYGVHEDGHASERAAEFILGLMCNRDSREFKGIPQES